jgi:hypothetical protein
MEEISTELRADSSSLHSRQNAAASSADSCFLNRLPCFSQTNGYVTTDIHSVALKAKRLSGN